MSQLHAVPPIPSSNSIWALPAKQEWAWVRFDEIAINVNERVDDPSEAGVLHYVGLDHLDSDSLKIRRWGTPDEVEATKLRFRKGDIIFGRRRAYQRKVGVADFDGICSAHALVLRANPKRIVPELLPFFMQTDTFMGRAVAISKGSLSPTINWPDLAKQVFTIPSAAEQERLLVVLRTAAVIIEAWRSATMRLEEVKSALLNSYFRAAQLGERNSGTGWRLIALGEIAEVHTGLALGKDYTVRQLEEYPYLRVANVQDGHLDFSEIVTLQPSEPSFSGTGGNVPVVA